MVDRWGNNGNSDRLFSWAPKSLQMVTTPMKLKDTCSFFFFWHLLLERKTMTNLDSILKSRDITLPTKVHIVKAMVFLGFPGGSVKNPPTMQEAWVRSLDWEDPLEEGMANDSSILPWRIPMDRAAWQVIVHGVAKGQTRLSNQAQAHVWMWELDHKEGWAPKNRCFQAVVLKKTLESPLDSKEIKLVDLEGLMLKLKL